MANKKEQKSTKRAFVLFGSSQTVLLRQGFYVISQKKNLPLHLVPAEHVFSMKHKKSTAEHV